MIVLKKKGLILLLVGAFALTSCSKKEEKEEAASSTLTYVLESPRSIDPNLATESEGGFIVLNTFEGLFAHGPGLDSGEERIVPGVAKEAAVSEDGLVWTFTLRDDAKWSNGEPVTAQDFEYSWLRLLNPDTAAEYSSFLKVVKGAEAYTKGQGEREDVGVKALDDKTFEVTLKHPYPLFKELTAFYVTFPIPHAQVEAHGTDWVKPENWVSNGPYVLTSFEDKKELVLEKNPHYWDKESVSIERIEGKMLSDASSAYRAFSAGQVDLVRGSIPGPALTNLLEAGSDELRIYPWTGTYMLLFNTRKPPFDDVRVRRAFNLAIDKVDIVKNVTQASEQPAQTLVPPMIERSTNYTSPDGPSFDAEQAKKLLAEAGYPGGQGFPEVAFRYNTDENHKRVAEAVQAMWKTNLGVDVELANNEWKVYLDNLQSGDFQMGRYGWIADYVDPMTFLDLYEGDNPNNNTGWSDPQYNQLIDAARKEADADKRAELLAKAEARFLSELPAMPLFFYTQKLLVKERVAGIEEQAIGVHLFKYMSLE